MSYLAGFHVLNFVFDISPEKLKAAGFNSTACMRRQLFAEREDFSPHFMQLSLVKITATVSI